MDLLTSFYRFLSIDVWGGLPAVFQREISRLYTSIYSTSWSRLIIEPYCRHHYTDPDYLKQFKPASGASTYQNFQDFFSREFVEPPKVETKYAWPAEGLLCEAGQVADFDLVKVKGEHRHLRAIFNVTENQLPDDYYYANIFLHNNNYHRIHAPVSGSIQKIEVIKGDLVLLRPWIYKHDPSLPALRNERVNIEIADEWGRTWFLSIVGGPAVGTIKLPQGIAEGCQIDVGEEIATFLLGSTCCMAGPEPIVSAEVGDQVKVGELL
ncbi:MAG: phosphatidylserine decarboxylase [Cyclobacteriaceae bacterium]